MRELYGITALISQDFRRETFVAFKITEGTVASEKTVKRSRKGKEKRWGGMRCYL